MSKEESEKRRFILRALALARRYNPAPNPRVGAVIVKDGRVVSEAAHLRAGMPHAEAEAIRDAGADACGADLYVTLEPCCHRGCGKRTPPCVDEIIRAGIKRVFAASEDPNPQVSGGGFAALLEAGIRVERGLLAEDEAYLNRDYRHFQLTGRPWIHLKQAASSDGFISDGGNRRTIISCGAALERVHAMRAAHQAVLVGGETVIADDPRLTVRTGTGREAVRGENPIRLVLEGRRSVPVSSRVFDADTAPTILYTGCEDGGRLQQLSNAGVDVVVCPGGPSIQAVIEDCGRRGIISVLAEAGGKLAAALLRSDAVDEVSYFYSSEVLGSGVRMTVSNDPEVHSGAAFSQAPWRALPPEMIGSDTLVNWYRKNGAA